MTMNAQSQAIALCYQTAFATAGRTVVYGRKNQTTQPIAALVGKSQDLLDTEFGAMTTLTTDYIFRSINLVWDDGSAIVPQVGDYIVDGLSRCQVHNPSGNGCYRHADPDRQFIRIHAEQ